MSNSERIFFFNRFFWPDQSATAQILTDLSCGLGDMEYRVTVVSSRLDYSNRTIQYKESEQFGEVEVIRLWSTRFGRGTLAGRLLDYLTIYYSFFAYILRNLGPDDIVILKTDPPLLSVLGAVCRELKQFRLVAWCQDIFPEVAMEELQIKTGFGWLFRLLKLVRDWSLHRSDRVVVLGQDMYRYLAGREIAPEGMVIIPNWSVQEDVAETRELELRGEWGIADDVLVIGYSGNLGRAHDWRTILAAAEGMAPDGKVLFLICGGGYGYKQLQAAVETRGLQEKFLFLPYQPLESLASSLRVPDVHWFTLKESLTSYIFPSKFFGILQAGRPVLFIGREDSEIARLIREEGIGCATRAGNSDDVVTCLRKLHSDPDLRQQAGQRARRLWEERYQKSNEIAKWHKMLSSLEEQGT